MPKKNNMFDLTKLAPAAAETQVKVKPQSSSSRIYTPDEQADMLKGFSEVHKDDWRTLKEGTYVRYLRKDGGFRTGGYVLSHVSQTYKGEISYSFKISRERTGYNKSYDLPLRSIEKLWKSDTQEFVNSNAGAAAAPVDNTLATNNANDIKSLMIRMEKMEIEIRRVSDESRRMVSLIARLHNLGAGSSK